MKEAYQWESLLPKVGAQSKITCLICGSSIIVGSPGFYRWFQEHGSDGSKHGIMDSIKRWFKNKVK